MTGRKSQPRAPKRPTLDTEGAQTKYLSFDGVRIFKGVVVNGQPGWTVIACPPDGVTEGHLRHGD